jgi:hypothetical protein
VVVDDDDWSGIEGYGSEKGGGRERELEKFKV